MKEIKDYLMKRKTICIIETCIVVMIAIMGYFYYQNGQKQKTLESMKIEIYDDYHFAYIYCCLFSWSFKRYHVYFWHFFDWKSLLWFLSDS